jgi:hypothetical protein
MRNFTTIDSKISNYFLGFGRVKTFEDILEKFKDKILSKERNEGKIIFTRKFIN